MHSELDKCKVGQSTAPLRHTHHWGTEQREICEAALSNGRRGRGKKLFNFLGCCCFLSFSHVAGSGGGTLRNDVHTDALLLIRDPVCQVFWVEVKGRESETKQKPWVFLDSFCSWTAFTKAPLHFHCLFSRHSLSLSLATSFSDCICHCWIKAALISISFLARLLLLCETLSQTTTNADLTRCIVYIELADIIATVQMKLFGWIASMDPFRFGSLCLKVCVCGFGCYGLFLGDESKVQMGIGLFDIPFLNLYVLHI